MPGYHLPFLAAGASGLFADHGLGVEILEPAPGPDNVRRVEAGGADACLTSVSHYLHAWRGVDAVAARFAAVVVQRSPMAGLVRADSDLQEPADLAGRRIGGPSDSALVAAYQAGLAALGLRPAEVVPMDYLAAPAALAREEIDAVPDFVDLIPRTRRLAGVTVRAVSFATDIYASGLVVADRLPLELVDRLRRAVVAALENQRARPDIGLAELGRRYPEVDPAEALEGWRLGEPNIFVPGVATGSMDEARWEGTIRHVSSAHGLPAPPGRAVYRPELTASATPA